MLRKGNNLKKIKIYNVKWEEFFFIFKFRGCLDVNV